MTTTPRYAFTGTTTLRQQIHESVGPRAGTTTTTSKVAVTVHATDQEEADRLALAAFDTPDDTISSYSRDSTTYRRWVTWETVTPCDSAPAPAVDVARVRAQAVRDARAAFYVKHEQPPLLDGATSAEGVGATHATNVCMDFLTTYADEQETSR